MHLSFYRFVEGGFFWRCYWLLSKEHTTGFFSFSYHPIPPYACLAAEIIRCNPYIPLQSASAHGLNKLFLTSVNPVIIILIIPS